VILERNETQLARNEKRLKRNETRLARNETRGGNLLLSGAVSDGDFGCVAWFWCDYVKDITEEE